jgi:hypothetical protein
MEMLKDRHVQIIMRDPKLNGQSGILRLSECGKRFIKLIPWTAEFQKTHVPWMGVSGEIHIDKADIHAIVNLDTVDGQALEQYARQTRKGDHVANGPADFSGR